jgi:DNA adenine methylase
MIKLNIFDGNLSPFLKWPGGKTSELEKIVEAAPDFSKGRFVEPFVGGGSVLLTVNPTIPAIANDICPELIDLYKGGARNDQELKAELLLMSDFWEKLTSCATSWNQIASEIIEEKLTPDEAVKKSLEISIIHLSPFKDELIEVFRSRLSKDLPAKLRRIQ